jgi:kumamolisin
MPAGTPPADKLIHINLRYRKDAVAPLARIRPFVTQYGLQIVKLNRKAGNVTLSGRVRSIERAFNTKLARFRLQGSIYRANTKPIHIPLEFKNIVAGVSGLTTLPKYLESTFKFSIPNHVVSGSEPILHPGIRSVGFVPPNKLMQITLFVRRKARSGGNRILSRNSFLFPEERVYLTRTQFGKLNGARSEDLNRVKAFAQQQQLRVVEINAAQRKVVLEGRVKQLEKAFGVTLRRYRLDSKVFRSHISPVLVPAQLSKIVTGVFGFDTQPIAQPHFQSLAARAFDIRRVAQLYQFPQASKGRGQCIGIIELGGGYRENDLRTFFTRERISPLPRVVSVRVDGGKNNPTGNPNGPDGEVCLDIEVAGAVAPSANIAVYFAPNTTRGFIDAVTTAVHDQTNRPTIISISWGSAEKLWQAQARVAMTQAFQDAATLGITVLTASGDSGSSDGVNDGRNHVDFPASSPLVIGCGGTHLRASGGRISLETAWSGSGGGFSAVFAVPSWQTGVRPHAKGRGVPDVAGNADPATGYRIRVDGRNTIVGGTSAVAPLCAGLLALINGALSKIHGRPITVGFINPLLYGVLGSDGSVRDVTVGTNGSFKAAKGWDPVTGWGSFKGTTLLSRIGGHSSGGKKPGPGTPGRPVKSGPGGLEGELQRIVNLLKRAIAGITGASMVC